MMIENLLAKQMDYVFFFYGASFVLLGIVCVSILRPREAVSVLPWKWLGFFGFAHGVNEWLDMFVVSLGDNLAFKSARFLILIVSYIFLMEFARRGSEVAGKRKIESHFYVLIFVFILLGAFFGWAGINAFTRYSLGLISMIWAALFIFNLGVNIPSEKDKVTILRLVALSLFSYGILGGLIVSPADFFPANFINTELFIKIFHLPVQFFRGIAAFAAAVSILLYAVNSYLRLFIKNNELIKKRFALLCCIVVFVLCLFFGFTWKITDNYGKSVLRSEQETRHLEAKLFSNSIDMAISGLGGIRAAAGAVSTLQILKDTNITPELREAVNERFDRFNSAFGGDIFYLMDKTGKVMVSSNRNAPDSFVDKNYSFRPYFKDAILGKDSVYLGSGITSGRRGIYVSVPVFDAPEGESDGQVIGVIVIKAGIQDLETKFKSHPYLFLLSPEDVIFISSQPDWLFRSIRDVPLDEKKALKKSLQFGDGPWNNVGFSSMDRATETIYLKDRLLYFVLEPVATLPGWKIILMDSHSRVAMSRFILIVFFIGFFVLISVVAIFVFRMFLDSLQLKASELLHEALVDASPDSIKLFDHCGICISVNKSGLSMLGRKKEDVLGKSFEDFWPMEDYKRIKEFMVDVLKGKSNNFEIKRRHSDGTTIINSVLVSPILDELGDVKHFMVIARDVTEDRRARERLLQSSKMATVGSLSTGVSHEFNNVLEIILGNAELAVSSNDQDVMKKSLKIIVDSARRAAWIVKTMLDFSGKTSEARELVDITEIIRQNLVLVGKVFEVNNIAVETRFSDVPRIFCNPGQLSQAFVNIMMNARDAMLGVSRRKLTISVSYNKESADVVVSFEDTGSGVKEDIKSKLFGPFVTTKGILGGGLDKQPGVGLGLFLAYGIIKQHNGNIAFESEIGKGTKFSVHLPVFSEE